MVSRNTTRSRDPKIDRDLDEDGVPWFIVCRGDGRPVFWTMDINDAWVKLAQVRNGGK